MEKVLNKIAKEAVDLYPTDFDATAKFIKNEFELVYGLGWHCVVGKDFRMSIVHQSGCFFFVFVGDMRVLLFK